MAAAWKRFQQDWQGTLETDCRSAFCQFDEISAHGHQFGEPAGQGWRKRWPTSHEVDAFGEHLVQALDQGARAPRCWWGRFGGSTNDLLSMWACLALGASSTRAGSFEAHTGLAVAPESLLAA